ncbi:MAG: DegT/DnrJ/EryC1/StrS aminotransferase family protein [Treponema sp.]|jgi:dTDP-4-amino-4,6-dideoxygalactose transaminase|nr:DegT/DnrJ/EryC1/StrS aminotransferase family protein [Treponema sp.]
MENIPFARPYIGKEEEEAVLGVLRSGWLTTGKETLEFEKDFGDFLRNPGTDSGVEDDGDICCMAVNSATSGLHLALDAIGIEKDDLVLVPSMTFTSTAEVVRYFGAEAVFVDVTKDGYHMNAAALESTLARLAAGLPAYPPRRDGGGDGFGPHGKARAVIPVHSGGLPCDMDAILPIARKYGLKVIEDAAHSFPSFVPDSPDSRSGRWAGLMGDIGVFSFYATKTITTGEGGMVVTRDKAIADRVRIMRSHGIDRSVWNRYTDTKASWYYEVIAPGFKYNIPDILSALGRAQLRRAMDLLTMRREIARRYDEAFTGLFTLPHTGPGDARHLYPLRLDSEKISISRDEFAEKLQNEGIGISVHFIPLHTMPYYKKRYSLEDFDFPETLKTFRRTISLPIWPGMTEEQINRVIAVVKTIGSEYNR